MKILWIGEEPEITPQGKYRVCWTTEREGQTFIRFNDKNFKVEAMNMIERLKEIKRGGEKKKLVFVGKRINGKTSVKIGDIRI